MQNLEAVAQKMVIALGTKEDTYNCRNFQTMNFKVWTVLSTEDILYNWPNFELFTK